MKCNQPSVDNLKFPKWIHDQLLLIANESGVSVHTVIKQLVKERIISDLKG